jgi:hypothetical protein
MQSKPAIWYATYCRNLETRRNSKSRRQTQHKTLSYANNFDRAFPSVRMKYKNGLTISYIQKKNLPTKKPLSREIKIQSMKNVCWKEKKHGWIPVGVLYSIGRKFRIAMTNIQRPYCFTRNKTRIEMEGERWHPFLLRHGNTDSTAMSYSQRKKGICWRFSGYILLVIRSKATSRVVYKKTAVADFLYEQQCILFSVAVKGK